MRRRFPLHDFQQTMDRIDSLIYTTAMKFDALLTSSHSVCDEFVQHANTLLTIPTNPPHISCYMVESALL